MAGLRAAAAVAAAAAAVAAAAAAVLAAAAVVMAHLVEVADREAGLVESMFVVTEAIVVHVGVEEVAETVVEALVQEETMAVVTVTAEDAAMVVDGVGKSHRSTANYQSCRSNLKSYK